MTRAVPRIACVGWGGSLAARPCVLGLTGEREVMLGGYERARALIGLPSVLQVRGASGAGAGGRGEAGNAAAGVPAAGVAAAEAASRAASSVAVGTSSCPDFRATFSVGSGGGSVEFGKVGIAAGSVRI